MGTLEDLPRRSGPAPETTGSMPHQQASQNAPPALQEALYARAAALPGVVVGPSHVSVPGARAFHLEQARATGPREAFMVGTEFAHLHPAYDGSLHLALPTQEAAVVIDKGWGEMHPAARLGYAPATALMVFGPRDEFELEVVWRILESSYRYAAGPGSHASEGDPAAG